MYARIMGTEIEGYSFAAIVRSCHFALLRMNTWTYSFACCVLRRFWLHKNLIVFPHCRLAVDGSFLVRIGTGNLGINLQLE